ncbi:hypothetical protein E2C01_025546 [Portunus trituberculatus]|uniref:Uncharacterized protein n=1 Tax=Portunus trituberculatus TaxID=210409 RepID=A0A5B7EFJ6_PORTR|nr:hypothetical protein [Portunus trituberculatus]
MQRLKSQPYIGAPQTPGYYSARSVVATLPAHALHCLCFMIHLYNFSQYYEEDFIKQWKQERTPSSGLNYQETSPTHHLHFRSPATSRARTSDQ